MERVRLSICGHDFSLKSDNPEKLEKVAAELQTKIKKMGDIAVTMSFTDIVMLVALDVLEESYDCVKLVKGAEKALQDAKALEKKALNEIKDATDKKEALLSEVAELKVSLAQSQDELIALRSQYENIDPEAEAKLIEENALLSEKVKELQGKNESLEATWDKLKFDYDKNQKKNSDSQKEEIDQLRTTVATYEKTFDEYATQRNNEVKALNEELNALRKKYSELSDQMNAIVNDGQLTL